MTPSSTIAFLGPSLPLAEARKILPGAEFRGPARQGDVLRALRVRPKVLALIDGVFESQPAVWHQELRVALSEGVHVLGASSMGALRAVELAPFGMEGVGEVFAAYRDGRLVDDAEVALLHADAEHDWRPLTVPLVNAVAAAEQAVRAGVITPKEGRALVAAARTVHYQDRRWPAIAEAWRADPSVRAAFEAHRRAHPVDVKAADARACLSRAKALARGPRRAESPLGTTSVWTRQAWVQEQPEAGGPGLDGLRTLLLADWARTQGLVPDPSLVSFVEDTTASLGHDAGLNRRWAEALVLERQLLERPGLLLAQAPSQDEGRRVDVMRSLLERPRRG